jgi:pimeloyl-ACP methyl ester carboxylesterase
MSEAINLPPHTLTAATIQEAAEPPAFSLVDYEYAHGRVETNGAHPKYTVAVPLGELASRRVIVYVNGLGAFKKTMRGIRNATANEDIAALSTAVVRRSKRSPIDDLRDASGLHVDHLQAIFDDLPNNKELLNGTENGSNLSFDKVDLVVHSYGGDVGVKYALLHPENVANLVMMKPVGQEKPELLRFTPRLRPFFKEELLPFLGHPTPDFTVRDGWQAIKHFGYSPLQTAGEIWACLRADHRDKLWNLSEKMGIAIITGDKDKLIPADPIEEFSAHLVDHYVRLETGHLGPQKEPVLVAKTITETIRLLDEKRSLTKALGNESI